jgi:hypothetical protein
MKLSVLLRVLAAFTPEARDVNIHQMEGRFALAKDIWTK